jgi:transcriptional regulator with XRE-family HTH domain
MWANWTKAFRVKHQLTQEGVADMLGVDPRTVRRWEAGQQPTKEARGRLESLIAPSPAHLMGDFLPVLLETSPDYIMLLDPEFKVLATSASHRRFMTAHHGIADVVGLSWRRFVPHTYNDWIDSNGGTAGMLRNGFVSRRNPYSYTPKPGSGKQPSHGIADHTLLRLATGLVHMTVTKQLPQETIATLDEDVTRIG